MGINKRMRLSLSTLIKLRSSLRTEVDAWTCTSVPSERTTELGGRMKNVDAVPKNMMTMKA
jgi:hypothetical protein